MAQLAHDPSTGFLRGESVSDEVEQYAQELKLLRAIEANTSEIAQRIGQLSKSRAAVQPEPAGARRASITTSGASNDPVSPSRASGGANRARGAIERNTLSPRQAGTRDTAGRFSKGNTNAKSDGGDVESSARAFGRSIAEAAREFKGKLGSDVDNVDPTIQAGKELSGLLSPALSLFKPLGRLFGRGKDVQQTKQHRENVTWLRRIWRTQADANKGKGGRGMLGMLGMLLALVSAVLAPFKALGRLLGLGSLLKGAGSLMGGLGGRKRRRERGLDSGVDKNKKSRSYGSSPGMDAGGKSAGADGKAKGGKLGSLMKGAKNAGGGLLDTVKGAGKGLLSLGKSAGGGLMKVGKGMLRKIPFLGPILAAGMLASDAMAEDDPELSAEDNKKEKWGNVGGGVGALIGGAVGILGGPAGVVVGGIIGDVVGGLVGEWLSTVDFGAVLDTISSTFSDLASGASKLASDAFDFVKDGWSGLVTAGTKAITSMVDWARDAWKGVTDKLMEWKDGAADMVQNASDYVGEKATSVKDYGQNLLNKATGGSYKGGSNARKDQLIAAMDAGGITDPRSKAALMASVDNETGGFTRDTENLNYSAKRLREVFPKYYKTDEAARADANNPEAIANKVYGGRMGNNDPGDGYKYRGRGDLQLTGKNQYAAMGKRLGIDLVNNPDLALDPKYSAQIAVEHWKMSGADKAAASGDADKARRIVNGGNIGMENTRKKYEEYLPQAMAGDLTPTRIGTDVRVPAPAAASTAINSTMAKVAPAKGIAGAQAVTPIGVMAPTQPRAAATSSAIPATLAAPPLSTYAPAAADASKTKIPTTPEVKAPPAGGGGKDAPPTVTVETPLSQNVGDRSIAHAAGGGIGMSS